LARLLLEGRRRSYWDQQPMNKRTQTTRISTRIADGIKQGIATGSLRAGDRLPAERTMVRRHRVSRVSVREAYRVLQDTGVVVVRRGSTGGAFIASPRPYLIAESLSLALQLSDAPNRQMQEVSLVEPVVAALAARHATAADLARLRKLIAMPTRDSLFDRHRVRFHQALADCSHNIALAALINSLANMSGPRHRHPAHGVGFVERACRWHRGIVDAIAARDETAAGQCMRDYLRWMHEQSTGSLPPSDGHGVSSSAA
jgi:GntR family transcriptional repressor for pyruvate dehydrogenase complex